MPEMPLKILEKPCMFRGWLENEKLRFDSAGASGSRLGPSRKANKNTEKNDLRTNTSTIPILLQKVTQKIATKRVKSLPIFRLPGPVSPNPSI